MADDRSQLTFLDDTINVDEELDRLFDNYVPRKGSCDTVAGEIVRAINKMEFKWFNDSCQLNDPGAIDNINHTGFYLLSQLDGHGSELLKDRLQEPQEFQNIKDYELFLSEIKIACLCHIIKNPNLLKKNNTEDMLDYDFKDFQEFKTAMQQKKQRKEFVR